MMEPLVIEANGGRFDALACGPATGELVLLLHGFPQFADAWLPVMPPLAQRGYRVVAVDQRGYSPGARPASVEAYRIEHLVADTLAFADALAASRFHLVGHDWGGLVAWQVAADHPERLRSVAVLSTPHPEAFRTALRSDRDQKRRSLYIGLFRMRLRIPETILLAFHAAGLRRAYQGRLTTEATERNIQRLAQGDTLSAALNWYRALSVGATTGRIAVPSLYLWGDADVALGEAAALATAGFTDGPYHFVRLAGHSHWLVEELPGTITESLAEHLHKYGEGIPQHGG